MRAGMYGRGALPGIAGVRYTGAATSSSQHLHPKNCRHYADSFEDQITAVWTDRKIEPLSVSAACRMATSISLFVAVEVSAIDTSRRLRPLAGAWHWTPVAMLRVEAVVDVPTEVLRAVEPRASPHEDATTKPFGAVISGRRTAVGRGVIVPIGTLRS